MDTNYKPTGIFSEPMPEPSPEEFEAIRARIRECIERHPDPNAPTIDNYCEPLGLPRAKISRVLSKMIQGSEVRQKEDLYDHDWVYRKGSNW